MTTRTAATTAAILLIATTAWAAGRQDREAERAARERIREFHNELRSARSDAAVVRAIERLSECLHPLVVRELGNFLSRGSTEIRIAAAEGLGRHKASAEAANLLLQAVERQTETAVKQAFLRQVAVIGAPECARRLIPLLNHPDLEIAEEATSCAGDIRSVDLIRPLIDQLGQLELLPDNEGQDGMDPAGGRFPNIPGVDSNRDRVERKRRLLPVTRRALQRLTGENWETSTEWGNWWRRVHREFVFPGAEEESPDDP